jgi:hypothetical protein
MAGQRAHFATPPHPAPRTRVSRAHVRAPLPPNSAGDRGGAARERPRILQLHPRHRQPRRAGADAGDTVLWWAEGLAGGVCGPGPGVGWVGVQAPRRGVAGRGGAEAAGAWEPWDFERRQHWFVVACGALPVGPSCGGSASLGWRCGWLPARKQRCADVNADLPSPRARPPRQTCCATWEPTGAATPCSPAAPTSRATSLRGCGGRSWRARPWSAD